MTKPDPNNSALYHAREQEKVRLPIEAIGPDASVYVKMARDKTDDNPEGIPLKYPFEFTVDRPVGGVHVVVADFRFPPEPDAGYVYRLFVAEVAGFPDSKALVATIRPNTPNKIVSIEFHVR